MEAADEIRELFEEILGDPRREYAGSGGWLEYNCPSCTDDNCGVPDEKYNLAVNFELGSENGMYMHCWKCNFAGSLSKLLRVYGNPDLYDRYKRIINEYKEAHLYEIQSGKLVINDDIVEREELKLPQNTSSVYDGSYNGNRALQYLYDRGVDDFIIKKHDIKYVGNDWGNPYRYMVIVPSYDAFGNLNYFAGRDYTGRDSYNKKNADIPKTEVVFNEELINWYEPITLVEGPFDHIVTPNSIPLLGKPIDETYAVYKVLKTKAKHTINIMLDSDALVSAQRDYAVLNSGVLYGRVRLIHCPDGMDPSDVYKLYGRRGILRLLASASVMDDYTLSVLSEKNERKRIRNEYFQKKKEQWGQK